MLASLIASAVVVVAAVRLVQQDLKEHSETLVLQDQLELLEVQEQQDQQDLLELQAQQDRQEQQDQRVRKVML
jgi:hypothetical protein